MAVLQCFCTIKISMQGRSVNLWSLENAQGFPGTVNATITYSLTDDNELQVSGWAHSARRLLREGRVWRW